MRELEDFSVSLAYVFPRLIELPRHALDLLDRLLASRFFSAQRSEHETTRFAVNFQMSSAVNRSRGGFSRL
jgi:hypothetical protein